MEKKISVVIPTYNRPHLLGNCLEALANQTFSSKHFEIVVVSDGPDLATEKVIRQFRAQQHVDLFFYSLKTKQGPAAARNMGWKNAAGTLIAFTDDDCLPDTNWLQGAWEMYNAEKLVAFTGKIIVPISEKPTDFELNTAGLETAEFVTANCIVSKEAMVKTGGFDEQFTSAWREDSDLHFKLMLHNIPIYKNTRAVVVHPVRRAPWGVSIKEQRKSMFNALLYKKYPELFRQRIKAKPTWFYYVATTILSVSIIASIAQVFTVALTAITLWFLLSLWFAVKRLIRTRKSPGHIAEMLITSMAIPVLSVYWTLYGAYKYKVKYL